MRSSAGAASKRREDDRSRERFLETYLDLRPRLEELLTQLEAAARSFKSTQSKGLGKGAIHSVKGRIKESSSLWKKAGHYLKGRWSIDDVFGEIPDLVGLRIVALTTEGTSDARRWIEALARRRVIRVDWKKSYERVYQSGYRSHHYQLRIRRASWPGLDHKDGFDFEAVPIEIQVRTLLQEAWGELEHPLAYKSSLKIPNHFRLRLQEFSARLRYEDELAENLVRDMREHAEAMVRPLPRFKTSENGETFGEKSAARLHELALRARSDGDFALAMRHHEAALGRLRFRPARERLPMQIELASDRIAAASRDASQGLTKAVKKLLKLAETDLEAIAASRGGRVRPSVFLDLAHIEHIRGEAAHAVERADTALSLQRSRKGNGPESRAVARTVAFYWQALWRQTPDEMPALARAIRLLEDALREVSTEVRAAARKARIPDELAAEYQATVNDLAYLHYLCRGDDEAALRRASKLLDDPLLAKAAESSPEPVQMADTRFAVATAGLDRAMKMRAFQKVEELRRQLVRGLSDTKHVETMAPAEAEEVLSHLAEFERKYAQRLRDHFFPREARERRRA